MSFVEDSQEPWQTTRPTIRERNKFMFNNDRFSDVKFVVCKMEGHESETKQVIPAHKFVLSISSPVFEAMFYGELAESKDSIELLTVNTRVCWSCFASYTAMKST